MLYYRRTVEYFVPAVHEEMRPLQPMSLLVFRTMAEASRVGFSAYNFGGTWRSQDGVHRFKQRWGARDCPYRYLVRLRRELGYFREVGRDAWQEQYPGYYVIPFAWLEAAPTDTR